MLDHTARNAPAPGDAAGTLVVRPAGGAGRGVRIENRRLLRLAPVICGLTLASAPDLLRRLLPVCGWAQGIACIRAIEAATATPPTPRTETARARLLLAEAALAHLWRTSIDWPALAGHAPDPGPVRQARGALAALVAALWPDGSPLTAMAGPTTAQADSACRRIANLLDAACAWLPAAPAELAARAGNGGDTVSALLRRARDLAPGPGFDADAPLPDLASVAGRLADDPDFGLAPDAGGRPADVTPFHALPGPERQACAALGPVAGRLAATLFDARRTARRLRGTGDRPAAAVSARLRDGWGAGTAATSRGPLVQALRVAGGRITGFGSVAPTEWMLHPDGALMRSLAALPNGAAGADARLVFAAFDPCAPLVFAGRACPDA